MCEENTAALIRVLHAKLDFVTSLGTMSGLDRIKIGSVVGLYTPSVPEIEGIHATWGILSFFLFFFFSFSFF